MDFNICCFRYHAIVHPFESRKIHSRSRTLKILACTWVAAIVVPTPLIYCKSYPFSIASDLGKISRRICTDRFDEIDLWMYGADPAMTGSFRRGFISFLFLAIYLLPSLIIMGTCLRISIALLKPWRLSQNGEHTGGLDNRVTRRQEENKRKVRSTRASCSYYMQNYTPLLLKTIIVQTSHNHHEKI